MSRATAVILIAAGVLGAGYAAAASGDDARNDIGVLVGYIAPMSDSTLEGIQTEADATMDYGLEYKHRFLESKRLSVGLSVLWVPFDVQAEGDKVGTLDNMPILLDANWHLLKNKNLYVGATAGYSMWGDFKPEGGGDSVSVKQNAIYGLNLGYDIPIGDRWAILTNVRYLGIKAETDEPGEDNETVDVNPIVANIGFAFRF